MISLTRIYPNHETYDFTLIGNDGEEQLTVLASAGQHGAFATIIVAMSIDGGAKVLFQGDIKFKEFEEQILLHCECWLVGSSALPRPTEEELKAMPEIQQSIWRLRLPHEIAKEQVQSDLETIKRMLIEKLALTA